MVNCKWSKWHQRVNYLIVLFSSYSANTLNFCNIYTKLCNKKVKLESNFEINPLKRQL